MRTCARSVWEPVADPPGVCAAVEYRVNSPHALIHQPHGNHRLFGFTTTSSPLLLRLSNKTLYYSVADSRVTANKSRHGMNVGSGCRHSKKSAHGSGIRWRTGL